jgi:hypothetical protein
MNKKKIYIADCKQRQQDMSASIQTQGFTVKAQRVSQCRVGRRCKLVLVCPWCMDRAARHLLRNLLPACKLAQDDADAALASSSSSISCCLSLLSGLLGEIKRIDNLQIIKDGRLSETKRVMSAEVSEVQSLLRSLSAVSVKGTKRRLRSIRRVLSLPGPIKKQLLQRQFRLAIKELDRETTYSWQVIGLTVKVKGSVRAALQVLRSGYSSLVDQGHFGLQKACFKMTEASKSLSQVHIHGFLYGPLLTKVRLSLEWQDLTSNTIVDVAPFRFSRKESVRKLVNYVHNPLKLPVRTKTMFWAENGSRIVMNAYGGIRRNLRLVRPRRIWKLPVRIKKGSR